MPADNVTHTYVYVLIPKLIASWTISIIGHLSWVLNVIFEIHTTCTEFIISILGMARQAENFFKDLIRWEKEFLSTTLKKSIECLA